MSTQTQSDSILSRFGVSGKAGAVQAHSRRETYFLRTERIVLKLERFKVPKAIADAAGVNPRSAWPGRNV